MLGVNAGCSLRHAWVRSAPEPSETNFETHETHGKGSARRFDILTNEELALLYYVQIGGNLKFGD